MFEYYEKKFQKTTKKENLPAEVIPDSLNERKKVPKTPVVEKYKTCRYKVLEEGNIGDKKKFLLSLDFSQVWKDLKNQTNSEKILLVNTHTKKFAVLAQKESRNVFESLKFNKYDLNSFSTDMDENIFFLVFYDTENPSDKFTVKKLHDIMFWISVPIKN